MKALFSYQMMKVSTFPVQPSNFSKLPFQFTSKPNVFNPPSQFTGPFPPSIKTQTLSSPSTDLDPIQSFLRESRQGNIESIQKLLESGKCQINSHDIK